VDLIGSMVTINSEDRYMGDDINAVIRMLETHDI
jgi:hypothetical protein